MADKPTLKYHIINGRNPKSGESLLVPKITDRSSMSMDQFVKYALKGDYVHGQFEYMKGTLNGFIEAMQEAGKDGYDVSLRNWLRIHGELTGSVGEDRQLTSKNVYKVAITALTDLKRDVSEFSWTNVDASDVIVKIESMLSVGGTQGVVTKGKEMLVTGKNLQYDAALGDVVTVTYAGLETPIVIAPTESDYAHMKFAWPTQFDDLDDGTVLTFKFKTRGGEKDAPDQVTTKTVVFKVA